MKLIEIFGGKIPFSQLTEAPIPDEWDKSQFNKNVSFKKRIEYIVSQVEKHSGKGSSRTAFEIEYQGRPTILKVAHNQKGMAQNSVEVDILNDGYASKMDIIIPIIDHDTKNPDPVWIHMEKARVTTEKELCSYFKCQTLKQLIFYAMNQANGDEKRKAAGIDQLKKAGFNEDDIEIFIEFANSLSDLSEQFDIALADLMRYKNWGIYKNRPVVIDLGFNSEVSSKYYSR